MSLRDLDLSHNPLSSCYLHLLSTLQKHCSLLSNLSIVSCKFHSSNHPNFSLPKSPMSLLYLTRLDLSSSLKSDDQLIQLASSPNLKSLEFLKLKHCSITNTGFTALFQSKNLRRVKVLILTKNLITKMILPDIEESKGQVKVRREMMQPMVIDIRGNKINSF